MFDLMILSVIFVQHQRVFNAQGLDRNLRQAILDDLGVAIHQWQEEGDQIVLLMDCSADVKGSEIQDWIHNLELSDSISSRHSFEAHTATYQRGNNIIDGIFTSHSIEIKQCGYLPFGFSPSDHRGLWIDINYQKVFGFITDMPVRPNARRLKTNDPHVVTKWQQVYSSYLIKHRLPQRQYALEASIQNRPLTSTQMAKYNAIIEK